MQQQPPSRVSLDEARDILLPRMPAFTESLAAAFRQWNATYAMRQAALGATAQAQIINDEFYFDANSRLAGDRGVVYAVKQLQKHFIIEERLVLRFKLLHQALDSRNYPTEQQINWSRQYPLDGFPPCERVTFGYRFDLTRTVIKDAFITLPNGDPVAINDWVWQVWGAPIDFSTFAIQLPLVPLSQQTRVYAYDDLAA